jgi:CDP-4-dehydro-6-deoxyglucose reductase
MSAQTTTAQVLHIQSVTKDILQVTLKPTHYIPYQAGQYLQIIAPWHEGLYYSIANAPNQDCTYEIHIRHTEETLNNEQLIFDLRSQHPLTIKLPLGTCTLSALDPTRPLIFIAGGTGITPINAMIEQLLIEKRPNPTTLYWLVRTASDLYMNQKLNHVQEKTPQFQYFPCLSTNKTLSIAALFKEQHLASLRESEIILAGPFNMVYALRDELIQSHVEKTHMHSDAFAFENK